MKKWSKVLNKIMLNTITACLVSIFLFISGAIAQQSTTGPIPSPNLDQGAPFSTLAQVVISGVPTYIWKHGCGPTAVGMVVGYWDGHGYDSLVTGSATTQTAYVNAMIANDSSNDSSCSLAYSDHYRDYSCPVDYAPNLLTDKSQTGGAHTSNCVADFMKTSWSSESNYYGWSWFNHVGPSFTGYVNYIAPQYTASTTNVYFSGSWNTYIAEINAQRPVVLLVDTDGDGFTDHFVPGIGYDNTSNLYACYNTWDGSIHWYQWRGLASGNTWGIYGFVTFNISGSSSSSFGRYFGSTSDDYFNSVKTTSDGGFIAIGYTYSFGAGNSDILLAKFNSSGTIQWARTFGGSNYDYAYSVSQTTDGGYILAGTTLSSGAGSSDMLVMKLNSSGAITWRRTFGGSNYETGNSIAQTSDGGYIVAGRTYSYGSGGSDAFILKLNSSGGILWRRTFGGSNYDAAYSIAQTSDGGYILAGETASYGAGGSDMLVLKLNSSGGILWRRTFGGADEDWADAIAQTSDGGYILAGDISSFGAGGYDVIVMRLNSSGGIVWRRTFGGTSTDYPNSIMQASDGGYVFAGATYSYGAGLSDMLFMKLNTAGSIVWRKTAGGTNYDQATSIVQTSNGGYLVSGSTSSFGTGYDAVILNTDSNGSIQGCGILSAPAITVTAPAISASAPALGATAPATSVTAPSMTTTSPTLASGNACT